MDDVLQELVKRMKGAFGEELVSMVLYGSAAAGDYHEKHSDLNVLCVLKQIELAQLERAAEPLSWWMKQGQPAPVLVSVEEIERGADAFTIEFLDMRENYRLLDGADLLKSMEVSMEFHRRQLEYELRARLLRLRKRFLETQHDGKALLKLMLESLPTFATLFRHALVAAGAAAPTSKREIFLAAAGRFGVGPEPFLKLLEVREGKRAAFTTETRQWFGAYLAEIRKMSQAVDGLG
jgi:predicted nucleotidyltransferase